jgi:outer membrane protein TolC
MKRLIFLLLFISPKLIGQDSEKLSLFECIKLARESHPYFSDKQRIIENTNLKIKSVKTQWFPQLNATGQATYQSDVTQLPSALVSKLTQGTSINPASFKTSADQYKAYVDVNQMLYDGGSVSAQKKIAEASSDADLYQNESELHKINEQVNQVYFNLLLLKENMKLIKNVKSNLTEQQKKIESGVKNGILQQSDLDNINIELLKNQQQIEELKINYSTNIEILAELTGKNLNDSLKIEEPVVEISDTGSFHRAELNAFDAQKISLGFSDKLLKSQRLPRVYAFSEGGYGRPGFNMLSNDFSTFWIVGINFKWNIWDWNKTSNDRQELLIQSDMVESKKQAVEKSLRISIDASKSRIAQLEKSIVTDSAIVNLRSEVSQRSSLKLEHGTITASDYINDFNAEIQAKIQMQTHQIQLVQEKVNYFTIKGQL